jgi:hypothetical protein
MKLSLGEILKTLVYLQSKEARASRQPQNSPGQGRRK